MHGQLRQPTYRDDDLCIDCHSTLVSRDNDTSHISTAHCLALVGEVKAAARKTQAMVCKQVVSKELQASKVASK
jgi:nitrate reductase cytochrome c-type subunit